VQVLVYLLFNTPQVSIQPTEEGILLVQ